MDCESCGGQHLVRAVQISPVPFALYLCQTCREAGVIPYSVLVTAVWLGDVDVHDASAVNIALYHGFSASQFEADCANFSDKLRSDLEDL